MVYNLHHIHLKSLDPERTAKWWSDTFNFEILSDTTRELGDRFIRCSSENGISVTISGPTPGQTLPESDAGAKLGLEHIAFEIEDIDAEIERLEGVGAPVIEGPNELEDGTRFCWVQALDNVRVELIQWPTQT
jgi:lactoylglutathione lyase